jgi:predicted regulator of Ras-like GTPase activity (Roadblock/LC7/MglB family)
MVCNSQGQIVATHSLFQSVEKEIMQEAATFLADSLVGLETVTGPMGVLDLRCEKSRIIVKPIDHAFLVFLCSKTINQHLLLLSCSAISRKIAESITNQQQLAPLSTAKKRSLFEKKQKEKDEKTRRFIWW